MGEVGRLCGAKTCWHLRESYFLWSPIQFTHVIDKQMLIQCGSGDADRSVRHDRLMVSILDYYGKPHRLSIHEGGSHNLSSHWPEALEERLDWMASRWQSR